VNSDTWKRVDLGDLHQLLRIAAVVARRVMRVWHSDLGIRAVVLLARELERDHAGDVCLERQNLQVVHDLRVVGKCGGARRQVSRDRASYCCRGLLAPLDLVFHLTNALEVLVQPCAVGGAHPLLEPGNIPRECIEKAGPIVQCRTARRRIPAFSKEPFEDHTRMRSDGSGVVGDDHERQF
jgi:hypothetical protein